MKRRTNLLLLSVNLFLLGLLLTLTLGLWSEHQVITINVYSPEDYENTGFSIVNYFCQRQGLFCKVGDWYILPGEGESMRPTLRDGKYYKCVRREEYELGDIIAFYKRGSLYGHRIIGRDTETGGFITRGDNDELYSQEHPQDTWFVFGNEILCEILEQEVSPEVIDELEEIRVYTSKL